MKRIRKRICTECMCECVRSFFRLCYTSILRSTKKVQRSMSVQLSDHSTCCSSHHSRGRRMLGVFRMAMKSCNHWNGCKNMSPGGRGGELYSAAAVITIVIVGKGHQDRHNEWWHKSIILSFFGDLQHQWVLYNPFGYVKEGALNSNSYLIFKWNEPKTTRKWKDKDPSLHMRRRTFQKIHTYWKSSMHKNKYLDMIGVPSLPMSKIYLPFRMFYGCRMYGKSNFYIK